MGIVAPLCLDPDEEVEPDVTVEEPLDPPAGAVPISFSIESAAADDDRLLRVTLNIDDAVDIDVPPLLLPEFGAHGGGKGEFLLVWRRICSRTSSATMFRSISVVKSSESKSGSPSGR
jgi:hypothetical protein